MKLSQVKFTKRYTKGQLFKGRNEPCCVRGVAEAVAALRGVTVDEIAEITYRNAAKMFIENSPN